MKAPNIGSSTSVKKTALVLSGGGARGAYEVGVVKALLEHGVKFDFVFGTSIGAINAVLIAQGDVARLEELWCRIQSTDIFRFPSASQIRQLILGQRWGFLDTSPLEELLRRELNLNKLKESGITAGFVTTDLCSLITKVITSDEIETNEDLVFVTMATSALPLLFPPRVLFGSGMWVDGGLVRNTPIQMAMKAGVSDIYTVLLHPDKLNSCPTNVVELLFRCAEILLDASANNGIMMVEHHNQLVEAGANMNGVSDAVNLHIFQPRMAVNATILDIEPVRSKDMINQGYEDASLLLSSTAVAS